MAKDRLAAMRAQQAANTSSDSSPSSRRANTNRGPRSLTNPGGAARQQRQNPYQQVDERNYEMAEVQGSSSQLVTNLPYAGGAPAAGGGSDMNAFYAEIAGIQDSLRTFNDNVAGIGELHARSLNNMDEAQAERVAAQLDELVADTSALGTDLKRRIQTLERSRGHGRDAQVKGTQIALVKSKFKEAIQQYQTVEQQFRQKYKQRMERQYKIVKPDASPEEVRAVVNDESGGQIFQQALMNSNRYGEARNAYKEVQERHEDIKRIEQTIAELAQLFQDISILVEQQDEQINVIEETTAKVEVDVEAGLQYTEQAVTSARSARKGRWICFWITLVLVIIIAIILVIKVVLPAIDASHKSNGGGTTTVTAPAASSTAALATRGFAGRALPTGAVIIL